MERGRRGGAAEASGRVSPIAKSPGLATRAFALNGASSRTKMPGAFWDIAGDGPKGQVQGRAWQSNLFDDGLKKKTQPRLGF
ncbi:hypothetical protein B3C1_06528 [Gallaecimonas xiamenensis 3-C-1]|uniref:Uncharacterized protein n=1 Tax=Gallaecimonas xiamenensis 3-C-1 TaxID=745411 RepID=K2JZG7_9GAMM|nr:hypothetical protein B3C1_06528 [Gallaecimonas xiamenensis 3-C-1]